MSSHRLERINGLIQRELSLILQNKIKDKRIVESSVNITSVKTTQDLKIATVYVSVIGSPEEKKEAIENLNRVKGFLRSTLGKILTTHSIPSLIFKIDDSWEYGQHIESILAKIKNDKESTSDE